MRFESAIDRLEQDVHQFRIDFERFLNGTLPVPPEELRDTIRDRVRQLHSQPLMDSVARFRLGTIEARFNSLCELYNRRSREAHAGPGRPVAEGYDTASGVVLDEDSPQAAVEALYRSVYPQRSGNDLPAFRRYLLEEVTRIRAKTGCRQVQFRIRGDGKARRLTARPLAPDSAP